MAPAIAATVAVGGFAYAVVLEPAPPAVSAQGPVMVASSEVTPAQPANTITAAGTRSGSVLRPHLSATPVAAKSDKSSGIDVWKWFRDVLKGRATPTPTPTATPGATAEPSPAPTTQAPVAAPTEEVSAPESVETVTAPVSSSPSTTVPTNTAPAQGGEFHATGLGASVTGAANGDFNRWTGQRHSMYSTWAQNGKVWGIDTASSEYGVNSVGRLGDYDLDIATMHRISSWASPGIDGALETTFRDIKTKWGNRQGHVFVRPFHEFNGDWYNWSTRSEADQRNFVSYWRNVVYPKFRLVFGEDPRFHLTWSPNRDSDNGLDVRRAFPGADVVDAIGVDYYDFSKADSEEEWAAEEFRTQNGGSPVGIGAWQRYAQEVGLPFYFPEYGVQYGDNPLFISKVLSYIEKHRYSGSGDASGKILNAVWHNLQSDSIDSGGGGDFFVQSGGRDYSGRPATADAVRSWMSRMGGWLATPVCSGTSCVGS